MPYGPSDIQVPIAERFFAGRRSTGRGFDTDLLGIPGSDRGLQHAGHSPHGSQATGSCATGSKVFPDAGGLRLRLRAAHRRRQRLPRLQRRAAVPDPRRIRRDGFLRRRAGLAGVSRTSTFAWKGTTACARGGHRAALHDSDRPRPARIRLARLSADDYLQRHDDRLQRHHDDPRLRRPPLHGHHPRKWPSLRVDRVPFLGVISQHVVPMMRGVSIWTRPPSAYPGPPLTTRPGVVPPPSAARSGRPLRENRPSLYREGAVAARQKRDAGGAPSPRRRAASLGGTLRQAVMRGPAVALPRKHRYREAIRDSWWRAFAHWGTLPLSSATRRGLG